MSIISIIFAFVKLNETITIKNPITMKNKDLIKNFVSNPDFNGRANSLTATNGKLLSYNTIIAQHSNGKLIINDTKYSVTTSKQQGYLRYYADTIHKGKVEHVSNIKLNCHSLV